MVPRPVEVTLRSFLEPYKKDSFLLAVSGGVDSMAMLYAFIELKKRWKLKINVAYVHHGGGDPDTVGFRNQSFELVKETCEENDLSFYSNIESTEDLTSVADIGNSEEAFRKLRRTELLKIKLKTQSSFVVFAHHKDDLLETRLLRLIRGCGAQGIVAMRRKRGVVLRPFLTISRAEMQEYLGTVNGHWVEDPSNKTTSFLRNWIRNTWLPALEEKNPGSKAILAQSLSVIAQSVSKRELFSQCFTDDGKINRPELLSLTRDEKKQVFALYLKRKNVKNYGLSHVNELVKRLDVERNELTFKLAKKNWLANARHIWCEE